MNTLIKGLIVALIATAATTITSLPTTLVGWEIVGITLIASTLIYLGQRKFFSMFTTTGNGLASLADFGSAALVAIGTAVSNWAATALATNIATIDWKGLLALAGTTFIGLLYAKFKTDGIATK